MLKAAIVLMLLATIASLFSGLVFLVKDDENSTRLLKALTVRVTTGSPDHRLWWHGASSAVSSSHTPPSEVLTYPCGSGFFIHNT